MIEKPLILIANDDGYQAKGLRKLVELMRRIGRVVVVTTEQPMSAQSHSITTNIPLRYKLFEKSNDYTMYICNGRPADCIKLGYQQIMEQLPDLVVSGINHGSNASVNVVYSGTMGAVIEACMANIPAVGFSLDCYDSDAVFDHVDDYVLDISDKVLTKGLPPGVCLNVNFPKFSDEAIKGVKVCRQAKARWVESFDKRRDPMGRDYFWVTGVFIEDECEEDTDIYALNNNYVSVVPSHYDWTSYSALKTVNGWFENNNFDIK